MHTLSDRVAPETMIIHLYIEQAVRIRQSRLCAIEQFRKSLITMLKWKKMTENG